MNQNTPDLLRNFFADMCKRTIRNYRELNQIAVKGQTVCAGSSLMENFPINEMLMNLGCTKKSTTAVSGALPLMSTTKFWTLSWILSLPNC